MNTRGSKENEVLHALGIHVWVYAFHEASTGWTFSLSPKSTERFSWRLCVGCRKEEHNELWQKPGRYRWYEYSSISSQSWHEKALTFYIRTAVGL